MKDATHARADAPKPYEIQLIPNENELLIFDEKDLPDLIQKQISELNSLDASVKNAIHAAEQAEKRAKEAGNRSAGRGFFTDKKKEAIEDLQSAGIELAGAVQSGAQAQKISFEFQKRLSEVTQYLFALGVGSIAQNDTVMRVLEGNLKNASREKISDLARQEMHSVVRRLKEREDILRKQQKMLDCIQKHEEKIGIESPRIS